MLYYIMALYLNSEFCKNMQAKVRKNLTSANQIPALTKSVIHQRVKKFPVSKENLQPLKVAGKSVRGLLKILTL